MTYTEISTSLAVYLRPSSDFQQYLNERKKMLLLLPLTQNAWFILKQHGFFWINFSVADCSFHFCSLISISLVNIWKVALIVRNWLQPFKVHGLGVHTAWPTGNRWDNQVRIGSTKQKFLSKCCFVPWKNLQRHILRNCVNAFKST